MSGAGRAEAPWVTHPWVAEGQQHLRFGVAQLVWSSPPDWPARRDFVQAAEGLGFDSYWAQDHPAMTADCWTTLAALAVSTRTIRLGTLVSCVSYRSPALLARMAADVDRLSGGRLVLGLGIGWVEREFRQLGIPFPPASERQEVLEETLAIVRGLWGAEPFSYRGRHHRVDEANVLPGPVQRPRVPIMIAGGGERVTLRQVAQHADASNVGGIDAAGGARGPEGVRRKYVALRRHCEAVGRPYETVLRSHFASPVVLAESDRAVREKLDALPPTGRERMRPSTVAGTPRAVVATLRALAAAGVQYFIAVLHATDAETLGLLAERVVPELQGRG
jgi:alkanesulfonate monooxygenase SsuD/methylene tetrahydromethanopterin reductase-like flavin-dependent oxidoreductase (luciferase family)